MFSSASKKKALCRAQCCVLCAGLFLRPTSKGSLVQHNILDALKLFTTRSVILIVINLNRNLFWLHCCFRSTSNASLDAKGITVQDSVRDTIIQSLLEGWTVQTLYLYSLVVMADIYILHASFLWVSCSDQIFINRLRCDLDIFNHHHFKVF